VSEMFDLEANVASKASSARECVLCHGTAKPTSALWLEKAGVVICTTCAHDLAESLTPKAEVIPVSKPVRKSSYAPYDQDRMAERIKADVYVRLLEIGLSQ
jgi:hypothetical protein